MQESNFLPLLLCFFFFFCLSCSFLLLCFWLLLLCYCCCCRVRPLAHPLAFPLFFQQESRQRFVTLPAHTQREREGVHYRSRNCPYTALSALLFYSFFYFLVAIETLRSVLYSQINFIDSMAYTGIHRMSCAPFALPPCKWPWTRSGQSSSQWASMVSM